MSEGTEATCVWTEDWEGNFTTSCGHPLAMEFGQPSALGMKFCTYCGKPIQEVRFTETMEAK